MRLRPFHSWDVVAPCIRSSSTNRLLHTPKSGSANGLSMLFEVSHARVTELCRSLQRPLTSAYIADANGKPLHSWRVLILPYIEQESLYQQYRFDEPWDSKHNLAIAEQIPYLFQCPSRSARTRGLFTSYVAVVGDETMWPGREICSIRRRDRWPISNTLPDRVARVGRNLDRTAQLRYRTRLDVDPSTQSTAEIKADSFRQHDRWIRRSVALETLRFFTYSRP